MYTFIIWDANGHRHTKSVRANNEDNAWEMIYADYPDAEYIELF